MQSLTVRVFSGPCRKRSRSSLTVGSQQGMRYWHRQVHERLVGDRALLALAAFDDAHQLALEGFDDRLR